MFLNFLNLFFLFLLIHESKAASNTIFAKIKNRNGGMGGKSVITAGDHMYTQLHMNLDELMNSVKRDPTLSREERNQRLIAMTKKHFVERGDDGGSKKIQMIQTADGRQQFTISFVGWTSVGTKFAAADKSGIKSMRDLGDKLDEIYREDAHLRATVLENLRSKLKEHSFLVTDGKDVYTIKVGRDRQNEMAARFRGQTQSWPKPPKIKKEKGNLFVQGWETKALKEELEPTFGGIETRGRGLFGRRKLKRVEIGMDEAKEKLAAAFKKQSERYGWPNWVSSSFAGFNARKGTDSPERIEHWDEQEARLVNSMPERSQQEVVDYFHVKGWMRDGKRWRNPELNRMAADARERLGPSRPPMLPHSSGSSASSRSGSTRKSSSKSGESRSRSSSIGRGRGEPVPPVPSDGREQSMAFRRRRRHQNRQQGMFGGRRGIFGRSGGMARRYE